MGGEDGKGCRCVGLATLPPSCPDCLEILRAPTSWSPASCTGTALPFKRNLKVYTFLESNVHMEEASIFYRLFNNAKEFFSSEEHINLVFWTPSIFFGLFTPQRFGNGAYFYLQVEKGLRGITIDLSQKTKHMDHTQRTRQACGNILSSECFQGESKRLFSKPVVYDYVLY